MGAESFKLWLVDGEPFGTANGEAIVPNDRPARSQLYLTRGDTFRERFSYEVGATEAAAVPVSVAGERWRFTVRDADTDAVLMAADSDNPTATATITLDADATVGRVAAWIDEAVTATLPVTTTRTDGRHHKFDWEREADGDVETLWTGEFVVGEDQSR